MGEVKISFSRRGDAPVRPLDAESLRRELRLAAVRDAALPVCALAAFAVPAVLVPLRGDSTRVVMLAVLVVLSGAAGLLGGAVAGALTGVMAGFSSDFFHGPVYGLLSLGRAPFWIWTAAFVGAGLVVGWLSRAGARGRA